MPSVRSAMATSLSSEFVRFRKGGKQLRKILTETKTVHDSIKREGCFSKDQLAKFSLTPEDESTVWSIIEQPIGFVVLGSTCWARACVVNSLLGRQILPVVPHEEEEQHQWRMVRFTHGKCPRAKLVLQNNFEVLSHLKYNDQKPQTVPLEDLQLKKGEESTEEQALNSGVLEISLLHPLLHDNAQVICSSGGKAFPFGKELTVCLDGVIPIVIYAIGNNLTEQDNANLSELQTLTRTYPLFFVNVRHPSMVDLTESGQHAGTPSCPPSPSSQTSSSPRGSSHFSYSRHHLEQLALIRHYTEFQAAEQDQVSETYCRLSELGFLPKPGTKLEYKGSLHVGNELVEEPQFLQCLLLFVSHVLQSKLLLAAMLLQETHTRSLQNFILAAFELSREIMITPKRIQYAKQREECLYRSLLDLTNNKQSEIKNLICQTILDVRDSVLDKAANYQFQEVIMDAHFQEPVTSRSVRMCTQEIRDMVVEHVNRAVSSRLATSIEWLQETFTGTLERCLNSLEQACSDGDEKAKQASAALKHILTAAYQVEISFRNSASLFWFFMQKMKQLAEFLPWKLPSVIDDEWKREVASRMIKSLVESNLARSICHQLQQRVKASHERFVASLTQLEEIHIDRLEQRENERRNVRCLYAPKVAKLSLESCSVQDMIQYGMPTLGQELGRGHYGVVYSCKSWAGYSHLAIKTVVLPSDKHWYSLSMEFFYHRNLPEHPRIVQLRGTVVDYRHDRKPRVYLIMDRMERDLYSALWNGLAWIPRLQVALDVIQGIRFLHSQGLVHRDVKLHNVLLDKDNRAKISDLGFCKAEAMMSGSVVGTPILMAPELLTGHYDASVDIYAFGILFWYICSGQPRLPYVYEQCSHREDLFALIKRGMRPERLPYFDDECWKLMCDCWNGNPASRPLPGDVEARLTSIFERFKTQKVMVVTESDLSQSQTSDCWSTFCESSNVSRSYLIMTDSASR